MTDEVAALVLRNNYLQTLALSLAERRGVGEIGFLSRLMQTLERRGLLDRAVEYLPDDARLRARAARRGADAARARRAARLWQADAEGRSPREPACRTIPISRRELRALFPAAIRERFPDAIESHRLRREIIATAAVQLDDQSRRARPS